MGRKAFIAAVTILLILTLLLVGMQAIEVAKANFIPKEIPTPPPIIINSPLNTTYNQNDILLNYTIVGISHWWIPAYHLTNSYYEIDGKIVYLYADSTTNTEQHSTTIVGLAKGQHTLTVHVNAEGVYRNNYPNPGTEPYSIESNQTVSFTVDKELENTPSPIKSPSPTTTPSQRPTPNPTMTPTATPTTLPIPSPTPTPMLSPSSSPKQIPTLEPNPIIHNDTYDDYIPMIIIIALVTVAVVVGLLVYFARRKGWR